MKNSDLVVDYLKRSHSRIRALQVLYQDQNWADVMRESQEVVELVLKAVLRHIGIDPPRVHDVSDILEAHQQLLPAGVQAELSQIMKISRSLRRDRELAFYGSEDLTPSHFYKEADAKEALGWAQFVVGLSREIWSEG